MDTGDRLIEFAQSGDCASVERILTQQPDLVNYVNEKGASALHFAALAGNRDLVLLLIRHGASVNLRDGEFGATPTGWAIESLREKGGLLAIEIDDLVFAMSRNDIVWVKRMLARFPNLREAHDANGTPLIEFAKENQNSEIMRLFRPEENDATF